MILGIKIKIDKTPNELKLSQEHEKILRKFEHFNCKLVLTPNDHDSTLKKNREYSVASLEYVQIIDSLMYLN